MRVDYVRVYQPNDKVNVGCSPPLYPTSKYIGEFLSSTLTMRMNDTDSLYSFYFCTADNLEAYENPNVTVLADMGQVSVFSFSASHCKHILNLF